MKIPLRAKVTSLKCHLIDLFRLGGTCNVPRIFCLQVRGNWGPVEKQNWRDPCPAL